MQILVAPLLEMVGDPFPQWRPTGAEMNGEDARASKMFLFQFIEFFRDHFRRLKKYSALHFFPCHPKGVARVRSSPRSPLPERPLPPLIIMFLS
jgi:hypothetical protein